MTGLLPHLKLWEGKCYWKEGEKQRGEISLERSREGEENRWGKIERDTPRQ